MYLCFLVVTKWQEIQKSKPFNSKKKKQDFLEYKVLPSCKARAQMNKKGKVVPRMHLFVSYVPTMFMFYMFEHFNFWWIFKYSWTISKWHSLNFIQLLRVVITPSVVEMRKRLEPIEWISGYKLQPRMTGFSRSLRELVANNSPTTRALFWVKVQTHLLI